MKTLSITEFSRRGGLARGERLRAGEIPLTGGPFRRRQVRTLRRQKYFVNRITRS